MYSYGWREYMPDIGRWNGIDQLAEKYLSTSTYAYVANNPVSNADVDGRWFNNDGSIDISGTANGFVRTKSYAQSYLGQYPGQGGGGPTPKNNSGTGLVEILSNFFNRLFGGSKGAEIDTFAEGATVSRAFTITDMALIPEGVETALTWEEAVAAVGSIARGGLWAVPLMLNGDSSHARGYDIPLTGATDVPADKPMQNLYLYRIMKNVNGLPMVGEGLDKLGLRNGDVNELPNSTRISPSFENGLSVTVGYSNIIPPNVPDFTRGKGTLFRIPASSLVPYGLVGLPIPNPRIPNYGQIRPAIPMSIGTFRALIQSTAPAWQPIK